MEITFTRGEERTYTTTALRDDGVLLQIPNGDRTFAMPHDMAHYVVEHGLGLKRGFWGRIAEGAIYPGMKVLSGRQPPHAVERSLAIIRDAEQQGVEAEVLVGVSLKVMHEGLENNEAAVRMLLSNEWRPTRPERNHPDIEEMRRICAALRGAEQRWQTLETGQFITVIWPFSRRSKAR